MTIAIQPREERMRVDSTRNRARKLVSCFHSPSAQKAAFTLVEVLVVISIIGILAAIAVPAIFGVLDTAKSGAIRQEVEGMAQAIEAYKLKYGDYPPDFSSWDIVERHYRRAFPNIDQSELDRLRLLTDVSLTNDTVANAPGTWPAHNPEAIDRAEALVWALGGFSSNPQFPFTGTGGPLARVPTAPPSTAVVYQANADRLNSLFEFEAANLNYSEVDPAQALSVSNRYGSTDEPGTGTIPNDIFLTYAATEGGAPFVYFDSRTYDFVYPTGTAPSSDIVNGFVDKNDNYVRPFYSDQPVLNSSGTDYASGAEAYRAWNFMNPNTFQIIASGIDGNLGDVSAFAHPGDDDATPDPIYFQYPTGNAIAIFTAMGIDSPADLILPMVDRYQTTEISSSLDNPLLDNLTNFSTSTLEDDTP